MENKIDLQNKTSPLKGIVEKYWFENENIGLAKAQFHRLYIPLKSFDSGLDYVEQPENTEIVIEWLKLEQENPGNLDGLKISSIQYSGVECSIYLGAVHNLCEIIELELNRILNENYLVKCKLLLKFEDEKIGKDEYFEFSTEVEYCK